jgi:hypothetical protein
MSLANEVAAAAAAEDRHWMPWKSDAAKLARL